MNTYDALLKTFETRYSLRKFSPRDIDQATMDQLLEGARLAPSSCNSQPWRFVVVRNQESRLALSVAVPTGIPASARFIAEAPVILACCAKPNPFTHSAVRPFGKDYHVVDTAIAIEHIVLSATALGLGSCWIGWFSEKRVRPILKIPGSIHVIALLALGYPAENAPIPTKKRLSKSEISCPDQWSF